MAEPTHRKRGRAGPVKAAKRDSELLVRVRRIVLSRKGISETRMFGGSCFTANGNMMGGVTGKDELMVRVGPDLYETVLQQEANARPMDFTGRPMRGFVFVDPAGYDTDAKLRAWLDKGLKHARSLPPKKKK